MDTASVTITTTTANNDYSNFTRMREAKRMTDPQTKGYKIMKIYKHENLTEFEFWSGAKDTVKYLTDEELDTIKGILEELAPDGLSETEINDIFWFEDDLIAEWLGYEDFEEIMNREEV